MGFTVAELERELLVDRLQNDNMRLEVEEARGSLDHLPIGWTSASIRMVLHVRPN